MEFWALFILWIATMAYWKVTEIHRDKAFAAERAEMLILIKASSLTEFSAAKIPATRKNPLHDTILRNTNDELEDGD